ncbi:glycoside hydrolase family 64 protein [Myriangium duriaei CBS 260.36]|uniref:Glycoside hydrolase family 64 protein n=1 Tax=Myriangium duriaei CBS 260.36 TaxID=1168546 RepID=A0A9P4JEJ1_9PEZI|nr:glycoside hydrolase family 64 protein [Myriangium duriaei CBS 260.36]
MATLPINLVNQTGSNKAFAYVTGRDSQSGAPFLIKADGSSIYYPSSPSGTVQPLTEDCAIPLGPNGDTRTINIPQLNGGRIWYSIDEPLQFFLNPGPAVVEPSVTNPSDANINFRWGFTEVTYNPAQLFANISYVDFVSIPAALTLRNRDGVEHKVEGTGPGGLKRMVEGIKAQNDKDNAGWDQLIYNGPQGSPLRVLSPNAGRMLHPGLLENYFDSAIDDAWEKYRNAPLRIHTQAAPGLVEGKVDGDRLCFPNSSFPKPSSHDVWNNSTGPFNTGDYANPPNHEALAIIPRLAAAINRGTILADGTHPVDFDADSYYKDGPVNHYSRILHEINIDGKGYAFPYDDVCSCEEKNVAGVVFDGAPESMTVTIGGAE